MDVKDESASMQRTAGTKEVREWLLSMEGRLIDAVEWNQVWTSYLATLDWVDEFLLRREMHGFDKIVAPEHPLYRKDYF